MDDVNQFDPTDGIATFGDCQSAPARPDDPGADALAAAMQRDLEMFDRPPGAAEIIAASGAVASVAPGPDAQGDDECLATVDPAVAEAAGAMEDDFTMAAVGGITPDSEDHDLMNRYVRLHLRYEAELEQVKAQMAAITRDITGRMKALEYVYGPRVRAVATALIAEQGRGKKKPTKSFKTPFGTVGFRSAGGGFKVDDEAAFLKHVDTEAGKAFTPMVRTVRSVLISKLDECLKESGGEIPPGLVDVPTRDDFYVAAPRGSK